MDINEMKRQRIGHETCLWFPVCISCKKVNSKIGHTDTPNLTCSYCGAECEDAKDMLDSGKMTISYDWDSINVRMSAGKSLGECL